MSIHLFASHFDQILEFTGEGSYSGRRLVNFTSGASGFAHGIYLTLSPGAKVLPHWHDDREAIFYCVGGKGRFILDDMEREVQAGDVMFQPLRAMHTFIASDSEKMDFMDFALFSSKRSAIDLKDCFTSLRLTEPAPTKYGESRPFFPKSTYGNPAIRWVGEHWISPGATMTQDDLESRAEHLQLVLEGEGTLELLGQRVGLRFGSVQYLIEGMPFRIQNTGKKTMRIVGTTSFAGKIPEPPIFQQLRQRALTKV